MPLLRLHCQHFRNLQPVELELHPKLNVFYGENGSGKTSLLEAIYFISRARSFRSKYLERMICHGKESFTLFADIHDQNHSIPVGLSRSKSGDAVLKIRGKLAYSSSETAQLLPILLFNQDSFSLLSGGAKARRALLDWGVFHQSSQFLPLWQKAQKTLRHRNILLKNKDTAALRLWDKTLAAYAHDLDHYRQQYIERFLVTFDEVLEAFLTDKVSIRYYSGWPKGKRLEDMLLSAMPQDLLTGYTKYGPHRADIRLSINGVAAHEILSRGQQKLLVCALKITQGLLCQKTRKDACCYLIDDISSELDEANHKRLLDYLKSLSAQVFITSISPQNVVKYINGSSMKLFEMNQGALQPIKPELLKNTTAKSSIK